jgi:hypothetical protein
MFRYTEEDEDELKSQDYNLDAVSTTMATEISEATTDSLSLCTQPPGVLGRQDWHKLEQRQKQIDYGKVKRLNSLARIQLDTIDIWNSFPSNKY